MSGYYVILRSIDTYCCISSNAHNYDEYSKAKWNKFSKIFYFNLHDVNIFIFYIKYFKI